MTNITTMLTPRQTQILTLVKDGYRVKEISRALGVSRYTVRNHLAGVIARLNAQSLVHAVIIAVRCGYLPLRYRPVKLASKIRLNSGGTMETDPRQIRRIVLPTELASQAGLKCCDCGSPRVVYFISFPIGILWLPGAYCYACMVKRVKSSRMIPFPIDDTLLNRLKLELGVPINAAPKRIIKR